jgi:hypothetical protein
MDLGSTWPTGAKAKQGRDEGMEADDIKASLACNTGTFANEHDAPCDAATTATACGPMLSFRHFVPGLAVLARDDTWNVGAHDRVASAASPGTPAQRRAATRGTHGRRPLADTLPLVLGARGG